ncbi:pilus assembly protein PilP [Rheinheimera baltica]|uniref:pilus assembly protein PilP n=1 Tax=Rheinheimera baltica TaxID=67576 RepID=UPI00273F63E2|nr:pilus assembly protein PilP [Rheinheimera baltica]MDP5144301.1 pilus assembly protein PilP [Rheinheimera baltica]MDP5151481.1 pilus assembly protein PilP [Rheinheimera baltica]
MKKRLTVLAMAVLLNGCFNDMSEVQNYVADVKANTKARVEPIPELQEFEHVAYRSQEARSPFSAPKPEAIQDKFLQVQDCLHPDPRRRKEPLEKYAVDNLKMRGTLGEVSKIWALIEASDKTLHKVTLSNYVGLFHGRVINVEPTHIELLELIPDGAGCWKERTTMLQMADASSVASN